MSHPSSYSTRQSQQSHPTGQTQGDADSIRRRLCTHLGRQALAAAPSVPGLSKWLHHTGPPPEIPTLPTGTCWSMINHLKVLHQYIEVLSDSASGHGAHSALLLGYPESCTNGLEWFAPLCGPMILTQSAREECESQVNQWRANGNPGLYSNAEAAYHVHQARQTEDPNMTRFLVSQMKPNAKEYEVSIAGNILRAKPDSFEEFNADFLGWRKRGLYHTMCLAARAMPNLEQWVPSWLSQESDDWGDLLDQFNKRSSCSSPRLAAIFESMSDRSTALNNRVCGLLDRVAILTRIRSNYPGEANLDEFLESVKFPIGASFETSLEFCAELKPVLEGTMPPSLLCPSLDPPTRGTWGYRRLELQIDDTGNVTIHSGHLEWISKENIDFSIKQNEGVHSERLRDILFRIGEVITSPEMAQLMYMPDTIHCALSGQQQEKSEDEIKGLCCNREAIIKIMDGFHKLPPWHDSAAVVHKIVRSIPSHRIDVHIPPIRLLAWRIDCPSKVILYEGAHDNLDLGQTLPHHLPKDVYPDKVTSRTTSGISLLASNTFVDSHSVLRACVASEIAGKYPDFSTHPLHKAHVKHVIGRPPTPYLSTTLAEAVAVFSGPLPENTSRVKLHESVPWDNEHIDYRYAEQQSADNGMRFRDWLTVYREDDELHRCRLASHEVLVGETFSTHFPVEIPVTASSSPSPSPSLSTKFSWVSVASTLPAETRTLRHLGGQTVTEALKRSVDNRFMNDSKLLPVRNVGDKVDRSNMEIYSDEASNQVLIAYAPTSPDGTLKTIEMMSFRPMPNDY